jgi:flagellar biosynthetic protein FliP
MLLPLLRRPATAPWRYLPLAVLAAALLLSAGCGVSAPATGAPNNLTLEIGGDSPASRMSAVQVIVLLTVLSLAPALLMLMTSFTRIIIVLSFVRSAIGVQQLPPNQVLLGLALFLTFFVMSPVWERMNAQAVQPYLAGDIKEDVALQRGMEPLRGFMLRQARDKDVELFAGMANVPSIAEPKDIPDHVLIPAFVISELKAGFQMGFMVFIPFLIIDLVVSSTLMSLGMMMLPPVVISLPFKVLLFIMVDGWHLITRSLLASFA